MILLNIFKQRLCWILACALFAAGPASARLQEADDLARLSAETRTRGIPVLIAFMQESCPYCAVARRDYLLPLQNDPQWRHRVRIVEIHTDRRIALRDFAGKPTTHRAFARSLGVRRVPTLIVFDSEGKPVAQPITGLLTDDFYRLYIEQAIEAGLARMRATAR